jgi:sterol desaturase/sphingolipid hydroxylase (fatty acid hydroxylase superfamily)
VETLTLLVDSARAAVRALGLSPLQHAVIRVALLAFAIYLGVLLIERWTRTRTANYASRGFAQDLAYWIYYKAGIHDILFMSAIILALEGPLSGVALNLFTGLPFVAHIVLFLVVGDFIAYWVHRAEHRFRFMWAFHTTHHSQEHLTFATIARFHPVEMIYHNLLAYIPLRMMGIDPVAWFPMYLGVQLFTAAQHTQIPWKLGPLYRFIATPSFHAFHHSVDVEHHDRNFANMFSFWDHLFGTAVPDGAAKPVRMGLAEMPQPTFLDTLVTPFRLLREFYFAAPSVDAIVDPDDPPRPV